MNPYVLSDSWLQQLLAEDVPYGDLTSFALELDGRSAVMRFTARYAMVLVSSAPYQSPPKDVQVTFELV